MNYSDIGIRIRKRRKELELTQEQLAEKCDLSVTHMSHIETGSTKLSLPTLVRVANVLNTSLDELVCDNIVASRAIYVNEIATVLEQCTEQQTRIITDVVKTTKTSLDRNY